MHQPELFDTPADPQPGPMSGPVTTLSDQAVSRDDVLALLRGAAANLALFKGATISVRQAVALVAALGLQVA